MYSLSFKSDLALSSSFLNETKQLPDGRPLELNKNSI